MAYTGSTALMYQIQFFYDGISDLPQKDLEFQIANIDKINNRVGGSLLVEFTKMYSANGDAISNQYGGSKAMHSMEYS